MFTKYLLLQMTEENRRPPEENEEEGDGGGGICSTLSPAANGPVTLDEAV